MRIQTLRRVFLFLTTGTISFAYGDTNPPFSHTSTLATSSDIEGIPFMPRATGWGLGGRREVGLGDGMLPLVGNNNWIFYTDGQGKYATDTNWYGGLGSGVRKVFQNAHILGAYVFFDRSEYKNTDLSSSNFWTVNPGIESLGNLWDFRINGYIPISSQDVNVGTVFADQTSPSGTGHTIGHQLFNQMVTTFNDIGPGIDGEIGLLVPGIPLRTYVGGYHFSIQNSDDINGVSGRLEYAFSHNIAFIAADTYDNQVHNSVEVGLRLTLGGIPDDQSGKDIQRRLMDPIPRNLSTLSQGASVPVVTRQTLVNNGQYFVEIDGIYFFTTTDGMTFDPAQGTNNCTFEHPCSEPSFTQTTVNDINGFTPNAKLFFSPGTYSDFGGQISINGGQSLFGRTPDYSAPAQGNERALFLGGMSLLSGNNQLDSIRILNSATDNTGAGSQLIALNIQNAPNVTLSNDDIQAQVTETANLTGNNLATGIYANNSQVLVQSSSIGATALVEGNDSQANMATGIGGNSVNGGNANFSNNTFALSDSTVSATGTVAGNNAGINYVTGIGGNSFNSTANFTGNTFTLSNTNVTDTATVGGSNSGVNFVTGIGGNSAGGSSVFTGNTFTLTDSTVSSTAIVEEDNTRDNFAAGIGGNNVNQGGFVSFNDNNFMLSNSSVSGTASVGGNNTTNFATGIGGNAENGTADFIGNTFTLTSSNVSGTASVGGDNNGNNIADGIGGNATAGTSDFSNNTFTISDSILNATALVSGINNGNNQATGVNVDGAGNTVTIDPSTINVLAQVVGNNAGTNTATGLNVGTASTIDISNSTVNVTAQANGTNTALATSGAGTINAVNTTFNVTP
jgi:hypothetical protein